MNPEIKHSHGHTHDHNHSLYDELICHLPYAVFSVAFALIVLSFLGSFSVGAADVATRKSAKILFHSFHFMHIVFAATGTLITFLRFSKNIVKALIIGIVSPAVFCMLSDSVLPYVAGRMLGVSMKWHLCFISEISNVLPFLFVGILTGFVISKHDHSKQSMYSFTSHAAHILISSLASTFFMVSHGFTNWYVHIGSVFLSLIIAVVIPCTLSDVVVPMTFAKAGAKK